jgi:hypothetical protein
VAGLMLLCNSIAWARSLVVASKEKPPVRETGGLLNVTKD